MSCNRIGALALLILAVLWPMAASAQISGTMEPKSGEIIAIELNEGQLVRFDNPAASVFITNPNVADINVRSTRLAEMSDGFIALPGGFGTLEEIIEMLTWAQLQFHDKPCGLLNVAGYYDHLLNFVRHAEKEGFLLPQHREMLLVASDPASLLEMFEVYRAPSVQKWRK